MGMVPGNDLTTCMRRNGAGWYVGFLGASYYAGQAASSFAWGVLSDRFGRRPILLLGSFGTFLSCAAFGFCTNYWAALTVRFLGGLLNGNIGVAKSLLGQISTRSTQAQLFGLVGLSWGAGSVVGSFYGGLLALPASVQRWPSVFGGTIFERFPFLLPNLVTTATFVIALVVSYCYLFDPPLRSTLAEKPTLSAVFRIRQAMLTTTAYALLGFMFTMFDEVLPVWLMSCVSVGGLEFGTFRTGIVAGLLGVMNLVVLLSVYKPIVQRLNMIGTFRAGLVLCVPGFLGFPLLWFVLDAFGTYALWTGLLVATYLRSLSAQLTFSTVFALIANSVDPALLGAANGVGQTLVAITRTLAPMVGAPLYAFSVEVDRPFPFNFFLAFFCCTAITIVLWAMGWFFEPRLDHPFATEVVPASETELQDMSGGARATPEGVVH